MKLLIRADASSGIGSGHVMRCLALAQAWQDGAGEATFLTSAPAPALTARLVQEGMLVVSATSAPGSSEDAAATVETARQLHAAAIVVDGYHFGAEFQDSIHASGFPLLFIDDNAHAGRYVADWVLNQNVHADPAMYAGRASGTRLLLGPSFSLLRREFNIWRGRKKEIPEVGRRVLITLGGSDPDNVTLRIIHALESIKLPGLEATVVAGGGNPHLDSLRAAIAQSSLPIQLAVNATNMPELMSRADLAISAGGSTCWELALLGLPACILVIADNQEASVARLQETGVFLSLGRAAACAPETLAAAIESLLGDRVRRQLLSERGQNLVDGFGAERVAAALRKI